MSKLFNLKSFIGELKINKDKEEANHLLLKELDKISTDNEEDEAITVEDYSHLPKPSLNEIGSVVLKLAEDFNQLEKQFSNLHIKVKLRELEFFATQQSVAEAMDDLTKTGWLANNNINIKLSTNGLYREYFLS